METPVGTASFYVDGGRQQFSVRDPLRINAHTDAYVYFARSVAGELFIGYPCLSVAHAREGFHIKHAPTRYMGGEPGNFRTFVFISIISRFQITDEYFFYSCFAVIIKFILLERFPYNRQLETSNIWLMVNTIRIIILKIELISIFIN